MRILLLAFFTVLNCFLYGQMNINWARSVNARQDYELGNTIKTDAQGNVYSCGTFSGTVDFDPGTAVYNLTSAGLMDACIYKLDANGNFVWAKGFGSATGDDIVEEFSVDANGDVVMTGSFYGTADFDPGVASYTMSSATDRTFVSKLSSTGSFMWAKQFAGTNSSGTAIETDNSNNIFVTGFTLFTSDYDPGPATYTLAGMGLFIEKLDQYGNFLWAKKFDTPGGTSSSPASIKLDALGNIYSCGYFESTFDFDPGAGTYTLASVGQQNAYISKLDGSGNFTWAKQLGKNYLNSANCLTLDNASNVYFTGIFSDSCDMDPGPNVLNFFAQGGQDFFVEKLDASGSLVWAKQGAGLYNSNKGCGIVLDAVNNVYIAGTFYGPVDFDPGPGTYTLTSNFDEAVFVQKLDQNGNFIFASAMANGYNAFYNVGYSIAIDQANTIYLEGFHGSASDDFDPGPGTYTSTGSSYGMFIAKYCQPPFPLTISGPSLSCASAANFSVSTTGNASAFSWSLASAVTNTSSSNTFSLSSLSASGTISITATNSCGISPVQTFPFTYTPSINVSAANASICTGSPVTLIASGASSYSWNTGAITSSLVISPASTAVYTVTGTANGCIASVKTVTVNVSTITPTLLFSSSSLSICSGQQATLGVSGATSYSWSNGSTAASIVTMPSAPTVYSVTGFINSCTSSGSISITVYALPNVFVVVPVACAGSTITLTATGANSYSWSTGSFVNTTSVAVTTSTFYTVTGSNAYGCTNTFSPVITITPLPVITIASNKPSLCAGETAVLNASGASIYAWVQGPASHSISVSPTANTIYSVTGTSNGCSAMAFFTLQVIPLPAVSISCGQPTICAGQTAALTASGASFYTWQQGQLTPNISVSPTITTVYSVSGLDNNNCSADASFTLQVELCTALENNVLSTMQAAVYPNPTTGEFRLRLNNNTKLLTVEMYNALGKLIYSEDDVPAASIINPGHYPAGVYMVRISEHGKTIAQQKIIKQ